jgi:predicted PurR-regulated permease PerM
MHATLVTVLGLGVHLLEANVVAPVIFEERVNLPPVLTILSVLVMASLLGVLGLLVAVPTLAAVMVILRHVLFGQIYGEQDLERVPAAVLVATTGEQKVIVVGD